MAGGDSWFLLPPLSVPIVLKFRISRSVSDSWKRIAVSITSITTASSCSGIMWHGPTFSSVVP